MENEKAACLRVALACLACVSAGVLFTAPARAEITLLETKDTTVYVNGRMQAFLNYNRADGAPIGAKDANGNSTPPLGGGDKSPVEIKQGENPTVVPGKLEDLRIRTGFVGNVLGFGFRHRISESLAVSGYTAVTVYIDSTNRRKYAAVQPDWRESYLKVEGDWGSLVAGRTLVLFSRGATEITYLYGYKYGLGWVGDVSSLNGSGPGAGMVGFGILGNGFGAGFAYATPKLAGAQLTVGIYDANNIPGSGTLERTRWPRGEGELTYESRIGSAGMFKLFANGAFQKIYERSGFRDQSIVGAGYGARLELGPVAVGLAGHVGKGIGVNFALEPNDSGYNSDTPERKFRTVDGYSVHARVAPSPKFDVMAAAGITRVKRLPEDVVDQRDSDNNPATPSSNDQGNPSGVDSVGFVPIKHQIGLSTGATYHVSQNLHVTAEYFRALFKWHDAVPVVAGATGVSQNFHLVNLGVTYDF